jgi:hypothetical protein
VPGIIHGSGEPPVDWTAPDWVQRQFAKGSNGGYRANYHRVPLDDADRYGSAMPLVQELHRRIADVRERVQATL